MDHYQWCRVDQTVRFAFHNLGRYLWKRDFRGGWRTQNDRAVRQLGQLGADPLVRIIDDEPDVQPHRYLGGGAGLNGGNQQRPQIVANSANIG